MATKWSEIVHKSSPEERARTDAKVAATLELMTLHRLRRQRRQTQIALASKQTKADKGTSCFSTNVKISLHALNAYVHKLGGQLEIRAVFPEQVIAIQIEQEQAWPEESKVS